MQTVQKKKRRPPLRGRLVLLAAAVLLLAGIGAAVLLLDTEETYVSTKQADTAFFLFDRDVTELASITIQRRSDPVWTASAENGKQLTILGDDGFTLTEAESAELMQAACRIQVEDVLTDDPSIYQDHLADYGLEEPSYIAQITYTDGTTIELRVGNTSADETWRYLLVSGDDRLFTISRGTVEGLFVNRDTLRTFSQPTLHKARIDRITLTGPEGIEAQWALDGEITDTDAADKWRITAPIIYPADSTAMDSLLSNIASLRLGAYVCPATEETLASFGFDAPRLTIDIHMAAGTIATSNDEGIAEAADWPEATVTYVIGGEKSDMVDYVLWEGDIYISSHFTMGLFIDYDVTGTMSRYPVMTALGNLASLRVGQGGQTTEYLLTRTEKVAENNELITDEDGNTVYDVTVTQDGTPIDYAAFEAAYNALSLVTVSGALPSGETVDGEPHTVYTFTDVDGTVHTVALTTFDVLHDAVSVDGHQAFYLIKGGFKLNME